MQFEIEIDKEEILERLAVVDIIDWLENSNIDEQYILLEYVINNVVSDLPQTKQINIAYRMTNAINEILNSITTVEQE